MCSMSWTLGTSKLWWLVYKTKFHHQLITNGHRVDPDQLTHSQWGLGIHQGTSLAFSACLASASTSDLQNALLAACGYAPDRHITYARLVWTSVNGVPCPQDGIDKIQQARHSTTIIIDFNLIAEQAPTVIDKAWLLTVQVPHRSDWLHALPISSCGLRLNNEAVRVTVGLRLGLELCQLHYVHVAPLIDDKGLHGFSCKMSVGRSL